MTMTMNTIEKDLSNSKLATKQCPLCDQRFVISIYEEHLNQCLRQRSSMIDDDDDDGYVTPPDEIDSFFNENENKLKKKKKKKKKCLLCCNLIEIDEYENHLDQCSLSAEERRRGETLLIEMEKTSKSKSKCLLCDEWIGDGLISEKHLSSCLDRCEELKECFQCKKSFANEFLRKLTCPFEHRYCFICLRNSFKEFAETNAIPICSPMKCDFQLSLFHLFSIPLEQNLFHRLSKLIRGKERIQCLKCHFYIEISEIDDYDEHLQQCDELLPCQFCHLPFSSQQMEIHSVQCQFDERSNVDKLTTFLLPRIRFPFSKEEIRLFIEQQLKSSPDDCFHPLNLIEQLAHFASIFPYEMARRDCDICFESCLYEDIYVFDCDQNHKLCYQCFLRSCENQMSQGNILTCSFCSNILQDRELNQLRISSDQCKQIRDYQMKKTFALYSNRTRGILKCPNRNCQWIAEAQDPNERFAVQCSLCSFLFCSLCNEQYHYRTTCQQIPQITQQWFNWCQQERENYLKIRSEENADYIRELNQYEKQHEENENRNRDLKRRYEELIEDEKYKRENCRLCPSCNRVVQRLDGCDTMICGQDAHGGNIQSGCQTKFNWSQAQPYQAQIDFHPKQILFNLPPPQNPLVDHPGIKCDQCHEHLKGIRFDCVHCPSLTFCEKCEQQSTLEHSRENQFLQQQQHLFRLIFH